MEIIEQVKLGRKKFYICKWDAGMYSIDRITKGFGGSVFVGSKEEVYEYANANGYKFVA